jgi:hypothetical protein
MNAELIERINDLSIKYLSNNNPQILNELKDTLKLLEYQSWIVKYKLRIIDNPQEKVIEYAPNVLKEYQGLFSCDNAHSKYHLVIPLMVFLFTKYGRYKPVLETSLDFMNSCKEHLKEGDFAKTKTGVQRFITNTKFAALELRKFGFLRSDSDHYFKSWELSLFGVLIAGAIYFEYKNEISESFFTHKLSTNNAYDAFREIIFHSIENLCSHKQFMNIMEAILDDEIVSNYYGLYEKNFQDFAKLVKLVIENRLKKDAESTIKFIKLLNGINADKEITKLADSIKLKKDIDVNIEGFFKVLNDTGKRRIS